VNLPILFFLTWLFPGLGHVATRAYRRAGAYAAIIFTLIILGIVLKGRMFVPTHGDIISYLASLGQLGMGLPYLILGLIAGYRGVPEAPTSDYGTLFLLSAGMMNLLLLIEVHDIFKGKRRAQ